jgi:asparagine synthase (glutamine-hydrolysing)
MGGDELFAGYERFVAARLAEGYGHLPRFMRAALAMLFKKFPESTRSNCFARQVYRFVMYASLPLGRRYRGWVAIFQDSFRREPFAHETLADPEDHLTAYFQRVQTVAPLGQLL